MASSPKKSDKNTMWILLAVILLVGAGVAVWWFFFREQATTSQPSMTLQAAAPTDTSNFTGKLYGNADLTHLYYVVDGSTVKIIKVGEPCTNVSWRLDSSSKMTIDGRQFTIQTDAIYDTGSGVTFDEMTGPVSDYCDLIGTAF